MIHSLLLPHLVCDPVPCDPECVVDGLRICADWLFADDVGDDASVRSHHVVLQGAVHARVVVLEGASQVAVVALSGGRQNKSLNYYFYGG